MHSSRNKKTRTVLTKKRCCIHVCAQSTMLCACYSHNQTVCLSAFSVLRFSVSISKSLNYFSCSNSVFILSLWIEQRWQKAVVMSTTFWRPSVTVLAHQESYTSSRRPSASQSSFTINSILSSRRPPATHQESCVTYRIGPSDSVLAHEQLCNASRRPFVTVASHYKSYTFT